MKHDEKNSRLRVALGAQATKLMMEACPRGDTPDVSHLESAIASLGADLLARDDALKALGAELRRERDLREKLHRKNKQLSQHLAELVESNKISVCAYALAIDQMARELRILRQTSETAETPHHRTSRAALLETLLSAKGSLL